MGAAAALFYSSNDSEKQTLHRRITPSDEQFEEQKDRWHALSDFLGAKLKESSGYSIRTWLQGSYKFGTQVRPIGPEEEFDIDLGIYYEWSGLPAEGDHTPEKLKSFVQDGLEAYLRDTSDTEVEEVGDPKPRCCRIHYRNNFHIDVPAYHLDADRDARSLVTDNGWEESDPKAIYTWFRDSFDDATRARVRRHVRYLKTWAML